MTKYEDHIRGQLPPYADERSGEHKIMEGIVREDMSMILPQLYEGPRLLSRTNYSNAGRYFDTYEEYMAQPYRGPVGNTWVWPDKALHGLPWLPTIVGTLIVSDISLLAQERTIPHLEQKINKKNVWVERDGFDGMATLHVFSYAVGDNPAEFKKLNVAYGEKTLADVIGNHFRYQYDEASDSYVATTPEQAKKNWLKEKVRHEIASRVGDDGARLADYGRLIALILAAIQDSLSPEVKAALSDVIARAPQVDTVQGIADREALVEEILERMGYR